MTENDSRVSVDIELADDEWYQLMKIAHEQDITLNQLVNNLLREYLDLANKEQS